MKCVYTKIPALVLALAVCLMAASTAFGTATIVIQNTDAAGVGFNDTTPASPVGGNPGTTVGQQRLNAFQFAADIWGATLTSGPTITIRAGWASQSCTANAGTLGSAGNTLSIYRDFPDSVPGHWYGAALRNAITNSDDSVASEITAQFNSNLGNPGCLENLHWYYGLNTNPDFNGINLVAVLLHEFAHGLGFQSFTNTSSGLQAGDANGRFPSIYDRFLFDNTTSKTWPQMTDAERVASAINTGQLAWNGPQVDSDAATLLTLGKDPGGRPRMFAPNPRVAGSSVSHWDTILSPNQLMEPNISSNLTHSVRPPEDLTFSLLRDIGWCSGCPQPSPPPSPSPTPTPSPTPIPSPPANDNFDNAQVLNGCTGGIVGTNLGATKEAGEPNSPITGSTTSERSVWYRWQAPASGDVTITTAGSNFDTTLVIYTGTSVGALGTFVARNDDIPDDPVLGHRVTSSVTFPATAGIVYRVVVNGFDNQGDGGDTGTLILNWTQNNCTDVWQPTTLTSDQVEIKTWTIGGSTSAYLKLSFPNAGYRVSNWGQTVRSLNDLSADASVEKFSGGSVLAVTTTAQIYNLGFIGNGSYTFTFKNSGTIVKSQAFTVSSAVPPPNPIDDAREFVRWQYRDFLNREPDQAGEDFWTDNITKCNDPARRPPGQTVEQCTLRQRETTSGAFFLSPEFQYTGYFVYRMYKGALGRSPMLSEFTPDALTVGNGIIVNGQLSGAKINQNKADFAATFVNCMDPAKSRCGEFKVIYDALNNLEYVTKLFQMTGVNASAADRAALVNGLDTNAETRASVLQKVVDGINVISEGNQQFTTTYGQAFYNAELNRAFVQLEYFGYMKRDPDEGGYAFWLGKLNQYGDFVAAEMVLAFITSPEYRARFGQP